MRSGSHALLFALLSACGSDGQETLIGERCKVSSDCDADGVCILDGKGGMCSTACEIPGGAMQCPLGNYCDRRELTTDVSEKMEMTLCLPACKTQGDCRDGYECNGVNGGPGKVCQPK
jgi:hypothetical protein